MSKLDRIAAFIAVVEQSGFAAAARQQGISTAAISRQVTGLEAELKVELLQRTTRRVSLTEIGLRYYKHCKNIINELTEADAAIADSHSEATGILKVLSNRYFAIRHLLPRLPEFLARNPKLRVKFELAERFPDLAQEGIDIAFGITKEGPLNLVHKRVAITRYVLCAAPDYLATYGIPSIPADLVKHRYIAHSMRNPDNLVMFKNNKEIYMEPVLWLNDSRALRECAIRGLGIVKLHDYMVIDALREGLLVEVLPKYQQPELPVYLYYQQSRYLQPKIRHFIDFFASHLLEEERRDCGKWK